MRHLIDELTDDQLAQELNQPSGVVPLQDIQHEMQKRMMMRGGKGPGFASGGQVKAPRNSQGSMDSGFDLMGAIKSLFPVAAQMYGAEAQRRELPSFLADARGMLPDTTSPVFNEIMASQQAELEEAKRSNKGRGLMEMGMAMMRSKDPSFLGALGEGGQVGLATRDKIKTQERGIMQGVMQAKLAQAQAKAGNDAAVLNAATGLYGANENRYNQAAGAAIQMGGAQTNNALQIASMQNQREMQQAQLAQSARQHAESMAVQRARIAAGGAGGSNLSSAQKATMDRKVEGMVNTEYKRIMAQFYEKDALGKMVPKDKTKPYPTESQAYLRAQSNTYINAVSNMGYEPEGLKPIYLQMNARDQSRNAGVPLKGDKSAAIAGANYRDTQAAQAAGIAQAAKADQILDLSQLGSLAGY